MNPHIFRINRIWKKYFKCMYMIIITHISVFMSGQKMAKNGTLARQTLRTTDLIHGMHTQLDFGSNMGGISPGYTFSHWYVKPKK